MSTSSLSGLSGIESIGSTSLIELARAESISRGLKERKSGDIIAFAMFGTSLSKPAQSVINFVIESFEATMVIIRLSYVRE